MNRQEHPTSNNQQPIPNDGRPPDHSMFEVGNWMLDVYARFERSAHSFLVRRNLTLLLGLLVAVQCFHLSCQAGSFPGAGFLCLGCPGTGQSCSALSLNVATTVGLSVNYTVRPTECQSF